MPEHHHDLEACKANDTCNAVVTAAVSFSSNPAMFKMEFTMTDPFTGQPEGFCPLGRNDIRWARSNWRDTLRQSLKARLVAKVHRYNKHLAVWHARTLIHNWSKGGVSLGPDTSLMGFMGRDDVALGLVPLGLDSES